MPAQFSKFVIDILKITKKYTNFWKFVQNIDNPGFFYSPCILGEGRRPIHNKSIYMSEHPYFQPKHRTVNTVGKTLLRLNFEQFKNWTDNYWILQKEGYLKKDIYR